MAKAWVAMDEISEGRARKKKKLAAEAIADFQKSKALVGAKDAVERMVAKWSEKTGLAVKPPTNIAEAVVHSEIRAHLAAMKGNRLGFLEKHVTDQRVASAVLNAPPFLSGLTVSPSSRAGLSSTAPEIAEARHATVKAMKEAEQGWQGDRQDWRTRPSDQGSRRYVA